jgi:hypothetical protein
MGNLGCVVADRCQICRRVLRPNDGFWCRYCVRSFDEQGLWSVTRSYAAEWAADRARKAERRRLKARRDG